MTTWIPVPDKPGLVVVCEHCGWTGHAETEPAAWVLLFEHNCESKKDA